LGLSLMLSACGSSDKDSDMDTEQSSIEMSVLGQYQSDIFDASAAEIVSYDPVSQRAFVINAASGEVDILDLSIPGNPTFISPIDVSDLGADANSVAVKDEIVAIAVESAVRTDNGFVAFYDTAGTRLNVVDAGALPDALTFSPDGRYVLVANEGEPASDYSSDPEGSVTIIDLANGVLNPVVRTADFQAFNGSENDLLAQGIRIFGPGASAAQDFEPEWVEISADSSTAYVSLQENNAIAVVDIETATVTDIFPLGFKDWSLDGQWSGVGFDASNRDAGINLQYWPVKGMFMPDTIRLYEIAGERYLITANEGDARDYDTWTEEFRIKDLQLDPVAFPTAATLQLDDALGRLRVTSTLGVSNGCDPSALTTDVEDDCVYDELYVYGGRSMSIFRVTDTGLELVFDTGSQMEETIADLFPADFNSNNDENDSFDSRSDDKGPEPEGAAIGEIDGRTYAFIGLERIGGVMAYDITEPDTTKFVQYINNRDFTLVNDPTLLTTTDLGAEGFHFIPAVDSPDSAGRPLLLVGNEVSGTTTVFAIELIYP
ncbi:MAG: choice-of-anchor I family protein, partial [Pelovirga sp.]